MVFQAGHIMTTMQSPSLGTVESFLVVLVGWLVSIMSVNSSHYMMGLPGICSRLWHSDINRPGGLVGKKHSIMAIRIHILISSSMIRA